MFFMSRKGDPQRCASVFVFLRFVADVGRNVHVNRLALVGFRSVRDTDDPDKLGFDVPQSEALVHNQLPTWRRDRDVNGDRFDACERRSRYFDFHAGGVVQGARDGRDGYATRMREEPPRVDGERLGEWLCGVVKRMKGSGQYVPQ